ncbi:MAG: hypothetical protein ACO3TG_01475 [Minisyncoccia bacterium]
MTVSATSDSSIVRIFTGTIKHRSIEINVRFDCYTKKVEPNELYDCIDLNVQEGLPYSVIGKNISNIRLINIRSYRTD